MGIDHGPRLLALGKLVSNASAAELHAASLIAGFVEDEVIGRALVADLQANALAQKLSLLSRLNWLGSVGAQIQDWVRDFTAAMDERNRLVHATWGLTAEDQEMLMRFRGRGKSQTPESIGSSTPVSVEEYEAAVLMFLPLFDALPILTAALSSTGRWHGYAIQPIAEQDFE